MEPPESVLFHREDLPDLLDRKGRLAAENRHDLAPVLRVSEAARRLGIFTEQLLVLIPAREIDDVVQEGGSGGQRWSDRAMASRGESSYFLAL